MNKNLYNVSSDTVSKFLISMVSVILLTSPTISKASMLYLKNEEKVNIDLVIEPGESSVTPNPEAIKMVLKPEEEKTIKIEATDLNSSVFTVTGKVKMPSLHNKCKLLLVDKDYKIIFTPGKMGGTICISEPL